MSAALVRVARFALGAFLGTFLGVFLCVLLVLVFALFSGCASPEPHPFFVNGNDYREARRGS